MTYKEFDKLSGENCSLCKEAKLKVGERTNYGAVVLYKNGDEKDGWFATLSPKTIGDIEKDFTIQIMPIQHLRHISEINESENLAEKYGITFAKVSKAIHKIMNNEERHKENGEGAIRIGTYGKSKHPEEHFHIKLFPWEHSYVLDTTYDNVKIPAVKKSSIEGKRLNYLAEKLIGELSK